MLSNIEKNLRRAVEERRYEEVPGLAAVFCQGAEEYAKGRPAGDPEIGRTAARIQEVLDWALLMVRTSRAALLEELQNASALDHYLRRNGNAAPAAHVRMQA